MNLFCRSCPDQPACSLLEDSKCPRSMGREIPFSTLSTASNFCDLAQPSSAIFCSSPDHCFKRSVREKVANSDLGLKSIAALTLLGSTDYPFSILEVGEVVGLSRRQLFYLKKKMK